MLCCSPKKDTSVEIDGNNEIEINPKDRVSNDANEMMLIEEDDGPTMPASTQWKQHETAENPTESPFSPMACVLGKSEKVYGTMMKDGKRIGGMRPLGFVTVRVWQAKELPATDVTGMANPYLKISTGQGEVGRTEVKRLNRDPAWHEEFRFDILHPSAFVHIGVYDWDLVREHKLIGDIAFPVSSMKNGENVRGWFHLCSGASFEESESTEHLLIGYSGRVYMEIRFTYDLKSERFLKFLPPPPGQMIPHLPHFDLDDLFMNFNRVKKIVLEDYVNHLVAFLDKVTAWEQPSLSAGALAYFCVLWRLPFLVVPSLSASLLALHMRTGQRLGIKFHPKALIGGGGKFIEAPEFSKTHGFMRGQDKLSPEEAAALAQANIMGGAAGAVDGIATMGDDMMDAAKQGDVFGMGKGMITGVGGAATGTLEGGSMAATGALRGVGGALGAHVSNRPKAKNAADGAFGAGAELYGGVDRGMKALIRNPIQDMRNKGAIGLFTGLGKGVLEATQGVAGGVINATASAVEGVAATPGAMLNTVGLGKGGDDENETASLGMYVQMTASMLPGSVKKTLAGLRVTLHGVTLSVEKLNRVLLWETPDLAATLCQALLALTLISLCLDSVISYGYYAFLYILDYLPLTITDYYFSFESFVWSMIPSARQLFSYAVLIIGVTILTCRTRGFQQFTRVLNGCIGALTTSGNHPSLKTTAKMYSTKDDRPTSVTQFLLCGDVDIFLQEWLEASILKKPETEKKGSNDKDVLNMVVSQDESEEISE